MAKVRIGSGSASEFWDLLRGPLWFRSVLRHCRMVRRALRGAFDCRSSVLAGNMREQLGPDQGCLPRIPGPFSAVIR